MFPLFPLLSYDVVIVLVKLKSN